MGKYEVEKELVQSEGIVATLFFPKMKTQAQIPTVITLGGGAGGVSSFRSELLASYGFATLSLAYFGYEGLPFRLQEIPLEYFEKAISWLQNHPTIDPNRIALWGVSRGAELS